VANDRRWSNTLPPSKIGDEARVLGRHCGTISQDEFMRAPGTRLGQGTPAFAKADRPSITGVDSKQREVRRLISYYYMYGRRETRAWP